MEQKTDFGGSLLIIIIKIEYVQKPFLSFPGTPRQIIELFIVSTHENTLIILFTYETY